VRQAPERRLRSPGLEPLFVTAFALFGFRLGARPIGDNSMFVHLRTGVDMARTGAIPRTDPYTFTAHGHAWVVQSWLPEWSYGWVYRIGGLRLVVLEQAVLMALMALLVARLARAGSPMRTALAAGKATADAMLEAVPAGTSNGGAPCAKLSIGCGTAFSPNMSRAHKCF